MRKISRIIAVAAFTMLLGVSGIDVRAATIPWTLNDFVFDDGGTASGGFVWDTGLQSVTSWNISVSGGDTGTFSPFTYNNSLAGHAFINGAPDDTLFFRISDTQSRQFRISLNNHSDLDTAVASVALGSTIFASTGAAECFNCFPQRKLLRDSGAFLSSVTAGPVTAVPVPAALQLLAAALAGFGFLGWRKSEVA